LAPRAFGGVIAKHGTDIALKIMPFNNIRMVDSALAVLERATQANVGLILDILRFAGGGINNQEIARIPLIYIKAVELDDAEKQPKEKLWEDDIDRRKLCRKNPRTPQLYSTHNHRELSRTIRG
jgi:sugar phosphate isomerase/epimerase